MNIIDKIKNELAKRLQKAADAGFIEIRMKASNDVVVITPDGPADDPETIYELRGFKLFKIFAVGLVPAATLRSYRNLRLLLPVHLIQRRRS